MAHNERYRQARLVTLIGAVINACLGLIKLVSGVWLHSHALVADGVHSFSDLLTDFTVLFASRYGSLDADDSHPYGHQRIETAATLLLALLLVVAGFGIAWDAVDELWRGSHTKPGWVSFPIALLSILANEALFHYTRHVGKKIRSDLIIANAWHHRSDAASSIVVALGILGALFGFLYFDAIAAIIVGLMIIKMGFDYIWNSVRELVDTAIDPETLAKIEAIIQTIDGVDKIHQLRSRSMGGDILIDVHILVSPFISVSEGHYIAQHVHQSLMATIDKIKDVIVHVDPEDDETNCPSVHLPNRSMIAKELISPWKKQYSSISDWNIHYLDGNLYIDLTLNDTHESVALSQHVQKALKNNTAVKQIRIFHLIENITYEQT